MTNAEKEEKQRKLIRLRNKRAKELTKEFRECVHQFDDIVCKFIYVREDEATYIFTDTMNCKKALKYGFDSEKIWEDGVVESNHLLKNAHNAFRDFKGTLQFESPIDIVYDIDDDLLYAVFCLYE